MTSVEKRKPKQKKATTSTGTSTNRESTFTTSDESGKTKLAEDPTEKRKEEVNVNNGNSKGTSVVDLHKDSPSSNFKQKTEQTEEANSRLLEDNARLLERMKESLDEQELTMTENKRLHLLVSELEEKSASFERKNDELQTRLDAMRQDEVDKGKKAREDLEEVTNIITVSERLNEEMKSKDEELKRLVEELRSQRKEAEEKSVGMQKQLDEASKSIVEVLGKLKDSEERTGVILGEKQKLQDENQSIGREVKELEKRVTKVETERKFAEDELKTKDLLLKDLQTKGDELLSELAAARAENQRMQQELNALSVQKDFTVDLPNSQNEIDTLKKEKAHAEDQLKTLKIEMEKLKIQADQKVSEANKKLLDKEKDFHETLQQLRTRLEGLDDLIKEKQSHIEDLQKQIIDLRSINVSYLKEIDLGQRDLQPKEPITVELASSNKKTLEQTRLSSVN